MKKLLYLGNYQLGKHNVPTYMELLGPFLEQEGYNIAYGSSKKNKLLRMVHMLWLCLKHRQVDLVLIDTYSTLNFYYALFCSQLCRLLRLNYICLLHGGNLPQRLNSNPSLSQFLFKNSLHNVAPSLYLKTTFIEKGYKATYIPNTIDIGDFKIQKKEFNFPRLLWVRSFSSIYNPILAIETLNKLKEKFPKAKLCMVGPDKDGTLAKAKKRANDLDLDILFAGRLTKIEWTELAKNYNVFINTSNFDNMPVSVIEAMALGLPIISTNVGGMPFLVQDKYNGVLVRPNESNEMCEAIEFIFKNDKVRNQLILNARTTAEKFDWINIKSQWFSILNA